MSAPEYPSKIDAAVLKIAGAVVLGMIMAILDITVVNVALPTFQEKLDVENYSTVAWTVRSEEHTSELQSRGHLVCRLLLEKKKIMTATYRSNISSSIILHCTYHSVV